MRAITLTQPWASLVAQGVKTVETRSWQTSYRGPIAIHAAKGWTAMDRQFATELIDRGILTGLILPLGAIVATASLKAILPTDAIRHAVSMQPELPYGDFSSGRFAWLLGDIQPLAEPVLAKGSLGIWFHPDLPPAKTPAAVER